jgi:hypothetical protein
MDDYFQYSRRGINRGGRGGRGEEERKRKREERIGSEG